MNKEEKIIIFSLTTAIILEMIALFLMIYFSKFEEFIFLFFSTIRLISPIFLFINLVFLIFSLFTRGIKLTIEFWSTYLIEYLRFFFVSFITTIVLVTISASFGALIGISLKKVYYFPTYREIIDSLRRWVAENCY